MRGQTEGWANHCGTSPGGGRIATGPRVALLIFICLPWLLGLGSRAFAEDAHVLVLPEIVIGGDKDKPPERCAETGPTAGTGMDCLNQKLKREVDRVNPPVFNQPPLDARSSDPKVGVINIPGVQQQYGKNFGVSAVPFRPPPVIFSSPVGRR